jgi:hypothetical protein
MEDLSCALGSGNDWSPQLIQPGMHGEEGLLGQINVWVNQLSNWRKKEEKKKRILFGGPQNL